MQWRSPSCVSHKSSKIVCQGRPNSLKINSLRAMKTGMNPWAKTRGSDSAPLAPIYLKELTSCRGGLGVIFVRGLTKGLTFFHSGLFWAAILTLNSVTMRPRPEVESQGRVCRLSAIDEIVPFNSRVIIPASARKKRRTAGGSLLAS